MQHILDNGLYLASNQYPRVKVREWWLNGEGVASDMKQPPDQHNLLSYTVPVHEIAILYLLEYYVCLFLTLSFLPSPICMSINKLFTSHFTDKEKQKALSKKLTGHFYK